MYVHVCALKIAMIWLVNYSHISNNIYGSRKRSHLQHMSHCHTQFTTLNIYCCHFFLQTLLLSHKFIWKVYFNYVLQWKQILVAKVNFLDAKNIWNAYRYIKLCYVCTPNILENMLYFLSYETTVVSYWVNFYLECIVKMWWNYNNFLLQ